MTKQEYKEYQEKVAKFFEDEGIQNLSIGVINCADCGFDFFQEGIRDLEIKCGCGYTHHDLEMPWFSNAWCDCCGTHLVGDRYHASGYNPETKEVQEYEVCQDCLYYAEYGQLDDMTMMDMEDGEQTKTQNSQGKVVII